MVMTSPNRAEELTTDALLARVPVGHHTAARREDRDTHARADARDAVMPDIEATARRRDAGDPVNRGLLVVAVAENDGEALSLIHI